MNILYILGAIFLFGIIIVAHELGHFLAARACGIPVAEFSIGMGPKLFGFHGKKTEYSVRAFPVGGYCKFIGEDEENDDPRAMNNQPVWKRIVTVFSGPFMNFVLAYLVIVVYLTSIGYNINVPKIYAVAENTSAEEAGLLPGDVITAVNGQELSYDLPGAQALVDAIKANGASAPVTLTVLRGDARQQYSLLPQAIDGGYQIGISLGWETRHASLFEAAREAFPTVTFYTVSMFEAFKQLFTTGEGLQDTMGAVGIVRFASEQIAEGGIAQALNLLLLLTLNVGIFNLLPIPALDGGRLVFLIIEAIRRKPVPPKYEGWVHAAGLVLLMGIALIVTGRDIFMWVTGAAIGG